uniref:N-acetyltransferase domain-containing protein n=1 Tax=Timema bartmani TaxID=61472 RepID=A0A7R9EZN3_9NEOP|nr:unnamed protein product [Timema bartmani]
MIMKFTVQKLTRGLKVIYCHVLFKYIKIQNHQSSKYFSNVKLGRPNIDFENKGNQTGRMMEYIIRAATESDMSGILNLMRAIFFQHEPFLVGTGFCKEHITPQLEEYCLSSLSENTSLVVTTKDDKQEIVAVCINATVKKYDDELSRMVKSIECEITLCVLKLWFELHSKSDIMRRFSVPYFWEVRYLVTSPKVGGLGMARKLTTLSRNIARDQGYPLICLYCTNQHSSRIAHGLGMEKVCCIRYEDFAKIHCPNFEVQPPHEEATVYIQRFKPFQTCAPSTPLSLGISQPNEKAAAYLLDKEGDRENRELSQEPGNRSYFSTPPLSFRICPTLLQATLMVKKKERFAWKEIPKTEESADCLLLKY